MRYFRSIFVSVLLLFVSVMPVKAHQMHRDEPTIFGIDQTTFFIYIGVFGSVLGGLVLLKVYRSWRNSTE